MRPNVRVDGAIFRRAAAVIRHPLGERHAGATYPGCTTPVHVLSNPVLLNHFDRQWIDERVIRSRAGVQPRFLFVGGDFVRKGGLDLLEAWRRGRLYESASLQIVTDWSIDEPCLLV